MIEFKNVKVSGLSAAIRGMRNPHQSWENIDTENDILGFKDLTLSKKLIKAGTDHSKFMRMITATMDITAPMYWWKEFDTYKVGTVRNSCSTMHSVHKKKFEIDDFSHEHLLMDETLRMTYHCSACGDLDEQWVDGHYGIDFIIGMMNIYRQKFIETNDKRYWWQMIQLLPSSYNTMSTVCLNYEVLRRMYKSRNHHKLDEWKKFCVMCEQLPNSELITED